MLFRSQLRRTRIALLEITKLLSWTYQPVCILVIVFCIHISGSRNRELLYYAQPLTGLYNKKKLQRAKLMPVPGRTHPEVGHPFFIMDMDCFKQINDEYGHATGDQALEAAAGPIFRQSDSGKNWRR